MSEHSVRQTGARLARRSCRCAARYTGSSACSLASRTEPASVVDVAPELLDGIGGHDQVDRGGEEQQAENAPCAMLASPRH